MWGGGGGGIRWFSSANKNNMADNGTVPVVPFTPGRWQQVDAARSQSYDFSLFCSDRKKPWSFRLYREKTLQTVKAIPALHIPVLESALNVLPVLKNPLMYSF